MSLLSKKVQTGAPSGINTADKPSPTLMRSVSGRIVCIGASTGGTDAIRDVISEFPENMPPILIVQHMPEMFTGSFARRLDGLSAIRVKEAEDGEMIVSGTAYLAPGHSHLSIQRMAGGGLSCVLSRSPPVNRHRPAVDVLFQSAAKVLKRAAIGVLLTGMGKDGAVGLLQMCHAGAWTIAQDQASCVVYGMPKEAAQLGAAKEIVPLKDIARHVLQRIAMT